MIFRRETIAAWKRLISAGMGTLWRTPSMRYRMRSSSSMGSTWMSLARSRTASVKIWFTNFTRPASSASAFSSAWAAVSLMTWISPLAALTMRWTSSAATP